MSRLRHIARAAMVAAIALLVTTASSAADDAERPLLPAPKAHAATHKHAATKSAEPAAAPPRSAFALAARAPAEKKEHRLILQVNTNDPAAMNLALNNAMNVSQY